MLATYTEPAKATTNCFQGDGQSKTRVTEFGDHQELRCASFLPDAYAATRMSELVERGQHGRIRPDLTFYIVSPDIDKYMVLFRPRTNT
jgi:hypothetical protein